MYYLQTDYYVSDLASKAHCYLAGQNDHCTYVISYVLHHVAEFSQL